MIIVKAMGGLGNQLQQYALYRKLESLGKEVKLDITWYQGEKVQASAVTSRALEIDRLEGVRYQEASPEEIRNVLGMAPRKGPKKGMIFVAPTNTDTRGV